MTSYAELPEYGLDEIAQLLEAVDRRLTQITRIVIVGGAAAAFHGIAATTEDVDTFETLEHELAQAIEAAQAETGLRIPINHSSVADVPWDYETRLESVLPQLKNLRVFILEKHDLALSKSVRGDEHDLQQLEELHGRGVWISS